MDSQNDRGTGFLIPFVGAAICCGGPLLLIGLAAVGPSILAWLGSSMPVLLVALAVFAVVAFLARRRAAASCTGCQQADVRRDGAGMARDAASATWNDPNDAERGTPLHR